MQAALVMAIAAWVSSATETPIARLLVLPLDARPGVHSDDVQPLSDFMVAQARRIPGYRVVAQEDVEKLLSVEMKQQLAGCDGTSCLAEIGGALAADEVLYGSVGRLGRRELVISLSRIDPRKASPLGGHAERLSGANADAMLDAVPRALHAIYPTYTPPEPRVRPMTPLALSALLVAAGSAIQYAAFATMFTSLLFLPCPALFITASCASITACCSAPVYVSALQAWIADLVGRRQMGFRWAALAGCICLGASCCHTGISVVAGALVGLAFSQLVDINTQRLILRLIILAPQYWVPSVVALTAGCALWQGIAVMMFGVPAVQTAVLLFSSKMRPSDADASAPGLYAPHEEVPGLLRWLPKRIMGGSTESVSATTGDEPEPAVR